MIPVSEPLLIGNERKYLVDCIDSGWLGASGPYVKRFEDACAKYFGRWHAQATSSGTAALHIALKALDIGIGDEVIVPAFTYVACAFAVTYTGAHPVFVDCNPRTFNIDPAQIEAKITRRTKAIMVAHIYGLPCDMDAIYAIAKRHELPIIEDAAEAHGLEYKQRKCGGLGDISILSFYGNKNVACGEGGMILTDDGELAAKCRDLASMSQDPKRRYKHNRVSWNYHMSNMQAAVGLAQLEQIDRTLDRKLTNGMRYNALLAPYKELLQLPQAIACESANIYWVYPVVSVEHSNDYIISAMRDRDIEVRPFFYPMHMQPPYRLANIGLRFPTAEYIGHHGFYLPSGATLGRIEIERVVTALAEIL